MSQSGFHPLDGANFLQDRGYSERLCSLVAYHSAAEIEALYFGCSTALEAFTDERSLTRDLLWFCDMTVSPYGHRVSLQERLDEVRSRYSTDSYVAKALNASMPERVGAVTRAQTWIGRVGLAAQV